MREILVNRGRLAEAEDKAKTLALRIKGDMEAIRAILDPLEERLETIAAETAAAQAVELAAKVGEYRATLSRIEALKRVLGRA